MRFVELQMMIVDKETKIKNPAQDLKKRLNQVYSGQPRNSSTDRAFAALS